MGINRPCGWRFHAPRLPMRGSMASAVRRDPPGETGVPAFSLWLKFILSACPGRQSKGWDDGEGRGVWRSALSSREEEEAGPRRGGRGDGV